MESEHLVNVYPEMKWHWKSRVLILLIFVAAMAVGFFVLPDWIVHSRLFFMLALFPIIYFVYTIYFTQGASFTQEPLTIVDKRITFRDKNYTKEDIGFYRYRVRGATYGSVIKLGQDVAFMCYNMDLPENSMYKGDYTVSKHNTLAIERDAFDALSTTKFA